MVFRRLLYMFSVFDFLPTRNNPASDLRRMAECNLTRGFRNVACLVMVTVLTDVVTEY